MSSTAGLVRRAFSFRKLWRSDSEAIVRTNPPGGQFAGVLCLRIALCGALVVPASLLLMACRPDYSRSFACNATAFSPRPSADYKNYDIEQLKTLAKGGDLGAARVIGERYEQGDGVEPDLKQAAQWYESAAFIPPQTLPVYMPGYGKVPPTTMQITTGTASSGDPIAMARLAKMYLTGRGMAPDPVRGKDLLTCATSTTTAITSN